MEETQKGQRQVAWKLGNWLKSVDMARSTYYTLKYKPRSKKIGRNNVITEAPEDWLARVPDEKN